MMMMLTKCCKNNNNNNVNHDNERAAITEHYRARSNRTVQEREASPIVGLKKLHAWIKAELIHMYARNAAVLDLACGKGADVATWAAAGAASYVGVDIVDTSVRRASATWQQQQQQQQLPFQSMNASFVHADCFSPGLPVMLAPHVPTGGFHMCSCQFALHYAWSSAARARAALANVASLLRPGGYFVGTLPDADVILGRLRQAVENRGEARFENSVFSVSFPPQYAAKALRFNIDPFGIQYNFYLKDAVENCPEWLVPFESLKDLAKEYGLEIILKKNFHEFVNNYKKNNNIVQLMHTLGAHGTISLDEWECVSIYLVFVFRKTT